jgi:putative ABC transport system permease protein
MGWLASFTAPFFLARRNMKARRGRTALTLLGIVLGVAVVLAIQITNQTTLDSLRQVFDRATGGANLVVTPLSAGDPAFQVDFLERLEKAPGVQSAAPMVRQFTLLASQAGSWQIAFSMTGVAAGNLLQVYGVDPLVDQQVRVYELTSGRMPDYDKYEVVIPLNYAEENGLKLLDHLVFLVPDGLVRLKIVGLLNEQGVSLINDGAAAFAPLEVVQDLFGRGDELDEIALQVDRQISEAPEQLENLRLLLDERLQGEAQVLYPAGRGQLVSQMLATYQLGLTFFSLIAIFVGAFLIYNAFSMTIVERTREIGMLRAIGMNRQNVLNMVLAEALLLSLAGSTLGLGVGIVIARGLIWLLGDAVTAKQGYLSVPLEGLLYSLAVGVGVTLLAAALPGAQAARISPLDALRISGRSGEQIRPLVWFSGLVLFGVGLAVIYGLQWRDEVIFLAGNIALVSIFLGATLTVPLVAGWLEPVARPLATGLYGNEGMIGSSNIHRSVGRSTLTVASLMVSLTMIVSIASLAYSFEQDMTNWLENALGGDLFVRSALPMRESFGRQLLAMPGVQAVTPARTLTVRAAPGMLAARSNASQEFYFTAIDPPTFRLVGDMLFAANQGDAQANWQRFQQGGALFISTSVADVYQLGQGDEIVLLTNRGEKAFSVAAVVIDFGGLGQSVYGSYEDMQRWFARQGVDRFTLKVAPGYTAQDIADQVVERFQASRQISVQTSESFKRSILDLMDQSFRLFDVLSLIGVIIGVLGVINTLTMNVLERQREIGGLRSLGMTRSQVLRMVLAEALALGAMGGVYGLVVGFVIANVLIRGANMMIGYDLTFQFTATPFLTGAVIAVVVVQLAALLPARRAAAVNIVEAIKHE